jgi:hypothetical protein
MVEAPTKSIKFPLVDLSHATFDGKRAHGLDKTEAGDIVAGGGFLK